MKVNMGSVDRVLRAVVVAPAALVIALVVGADSVAGVVLLALAAIMLLTAAVGFCPLYKLVGLDTRSLRKARRAHSA
jgi:hypothetical protein